MATRAIASSSRGGDGRLWAIALGLSLLLNTGILTLLGLAALRTQRLPKSNTAPPVATADSTILIFPDATSPTPKPVTASPSFARTSDDQTATPPKKSTRIGERDTLATSDRVPDASAPPLPSQKGVEPRNPADLETTESRYQDGSLANNELTKTQNPFAQTPTSMPAPLPDPSLADNPAPGENSASPGKDAAQSTPSPREALIEGPNPVDVPVPMDSTTKSEIKPTPPKQAKQGKQAPAPADLPKPPVAKAANAPGFRGHQRKTAIVGSISRTGRSALDVADTALGRYQAIISRAVEQEWQRNCVRHRDFITPGFLTVRFYVETNGKVRTVQFVGSMETGEVQKGFTLNSIRNAEIPPMNPTLRKDFENEPLELIFNFYF